MNEVKNLRPRHAFGYDGTWINIYHANIGEGLAKHDHIYTHCTACYAGKLKVTKEKGEWILTKESTPVVLTAGEWHELEAIEDGTVWTNIFAQEFMDQDMATHRYTK